MILYLSNLAAGTKPDELQKAFSAHGTVSSVSLPREQMKNGRPAGAGRGYAFVTMPDAAQANAALGALDKQKIGGREVSVKAARPERYFRHRR